MGGRNIWPDLRMIGFISALKAGRMQYAPTAPYSVKPNRQRHFLTRVHGFAWTDEPGGACNVLMQSLGGRPRRFGLQSALQVPGSSARDGKFPWTAVGRRGHR